MTDEDLAALMNAKPGWQDGRGLFPAYASKGFDAVEGAWIDPGPARISRVMKKDDEVRDNDDGVNFQPPACPTSGTIMVVLSGIASCGCMPGANSSAKITAFSGLNGAHTLTWDAGPGPTSGTFVLNGFGSCTFEQYDDETCSNVVGTIDGNFNIQAICGGGTWNVVVTIFAVGFTIFEAVAAPSGTPMDNTIVCPGTNGMGGGTATVS